MKSLRVPVLVGVAVTAVVAAVALLLLTEKPGVPAPGAGTVTDAGGQALVRSFEDSPDGATATEGGADPAASTRGPSPLEIPSVTDAHRPLVDDGLAASPRLVEFVADLERINDVFLPISRRRALVLERAETYLGETFGAHQQAEAIALLADAHGRSDEARAGVALARAALGEGAAVLSDLERVSWDWRPDVAAATAWDPLSLDARGLSLSAEDLSKVVLERRDALLPLVCTRPPDAAAFDWARQEVSGRDRRTAVAALLILGTGLDRKPKVIAPILRDVIEGRPTREISLRPRGSFKRSVSLQRSPNVELAALWVLARGKSETARGTLTQLLRATVDIEGLDIRESTARMMRLVSFADVLTHEPQLVPELRNTLRDASADEAERLLAAVSLLAVAQDKEGSAETAREAQGVLAEVLPGEKDHAVAFAELSALSMSLEFERIRRGLSIGFGSPEAPPAEHEEAVRAALESRLLNDLRPQHRALAALALRDFATEPAATRARDALRAALRVESDAAVRERILIALGPDR